MNVDGKQPPAQAVEQDQSRGKTKIQVIVREATEADLADTILIFWSAFEPIFPFHETEPPSLRPPTPTRLRRSVHRQNAVLRNPGSLILVAEDAENKELLGWAGYVRPEACRKPHPWIVEDGEVKTDEDREAWQGVDRAHFNSLWKGWDEYRWKVLDDRDHWLLAPLCVKPSAQGRGVGTALLRHLNSIVDSSSPAVPVYLDASKAGQPVYLKEGFEYFGEEGRPFPGMVRWGKAERPAAATSSTS